jgi:hypothetical protein
MAITLSTGDFRLRRLDEWSGSEPPVLIEAECGVERVDEIVMATDVFGRKVLSSPDIYSLLDGANRIVAAIGFAAGVTLSAHAADFEEEPANRYIAETREDQRTLRSFGVDGARLPLTATTAVEVADHYPVDAQLIQTLAERGAVTVYEEVLGSTTQTGRFRELWRVLEFAFQAHGRKLVNLLVNYPPAIELGFDRDELEALRVLRGRISHAASRAGTTEITHTRGASLVHTGRLWSLVDYIILTKKDASNSLDVEELRPLRAFIDRDGRPQFSPEIADPAAWAEEHMNSRAARFRTDD